MSLEKLVLLLALGLVGCGDQQSQRSTSDSANQEAKKVTGNVTVNDDGKEIEVEVDPASLPADFATKSEQEQADFIRERLTKETSKDQMGLWFGWWAPFAYNYSPAVYTASYRCGPILGCRARYVYSGYGY